MLMTNKNILVAACFAVLVSGCNDNNNQQQNDQENQQPTTATFSPVEGTISQLHAALAANTTSCEAVVQSYLDRIAAYDDVGPELHAVISTNPNALAEARALDERYAETGEMNSLHCVTVLVKDNFDTNDMATTAGGLAMQFNLPPDNAFTIGRMKQRGAIILGKANLDEFAFGYEGSSSIEGQTKNAYDLERGPGGSSSGTGAAIAASFAMVGTGTDTGGSIRIPSSVEGLVGIRPSLRLVSQDGIVPLSHSQDTGGPMCRTVEDCAHLLDAMVGFDSSAHSGQRENFAYDAPLISSPFLYQIITGVPHSYTQYLDEGALNGARIGVVREMFGDGSEQQNQVVQATIEAALAQMQAAGAVVEEVTIPKLSEIFERYKSVSRYEFCNDLTDYLGSWSELADGHHLSFAALAASFDYEVRHQQYFYYYGLFCGDQSANEDYQLNQTERPTQVRNALMQALNNVDDAGIPQGQAYDVLLYPTMLGLASELGQAPLAGDNNRLSPFSGFPALTMPAGMTNSEPQLPVGMEMLAREFDEASLIKIAYAYEKMAQPRQAPSHTPAL